MLISNSHKLDIDDYLQYLFSKHHVVPGTQADSFEEVIDSVVGVHSARLPTPYVAFHARMKKVEPSDYRMATNASNRLIKLRCMRKTLHTVTQTLAPIVHIATLELRTSELQLQLKKRRYSLEDTKEIRRKILETTLASPQRHNDLLKNIAHLITKSTNASQKNTARTARVLLKWLWETGQICYINQATHWSHEVRLYGNIQHLYPSLQINAIKREEAISQLVFRHVQAFGPVSEKDIAWWSGIRITEIRRALESMRSDLVRVDLNDVANDLVMTKQRLNEFINFKKLAHGTLWCAFLAYEDPTLKGYFNTRARYVDSVNYNKLFNQIGEVRPSVVINGRAIGVWQWNKKTKTVSVKTFRVLSKKERIVVTESRQKLENYLCEELQSKLKLPV